MRRPPKTHELSAQFVDDTRDEHYRAAGIDKPAARTDPRKQPVEGEDLDVEASRSAQPLHERDLRLKRKAVGNDDVMLMLESFFPFFHFLRDAPKTHRGRIRGVQLHTL